MVSILGYDIYSDAMVEFAIFLASGVVFLTIVVSIQVLIIRAFLNYRAHQRKRFLAYWRPVFTEATMDKVSRIPPLPKKHLNYFIVEWNDLYEKMRGDSREGLRDLAYQVNLSQIVTTKLISRTPRERLTAIVTLGHLKEKYTWNVLLAIAQSDELVLSLAALRALIQIDASHALAVTLPMIIERRDWPGAMIVKILKEAQATNSCDLLAHAAMEADEKKLPRLLQYLAAIGCKQTTTVSRHILEKECDGRVLSLILQSLNDPEAVDIARRYTSHFRWHVRMQAATALGKIGDQNDVNALVQLLYDKEWWVRYRAAQSLLSLPFLDEEEIEKIYQEIDDGFGRDILQQVRAEREFQI